MESDFRFDDRLIDEPSDTGDLDLHPPTTGEGPERRPNARPPTPEPVTGPWFPLSMGVSIAWAALTLIGMTAQRSAGELGAWILIGGFITLYCSFLYFGSVWFDSWRHP